MTTWAKRFQFYAGVLLNWGVYENEAFAGCRGAGRVVGGLVGLGCGR